MRNSYFIRLIFGKLNIKRKLAFNEQLFQYNFFFQIPYINYARARIRIFSRIEKLNLTIACSASSPPPIKVEILE